MILYQDDWFYVFAVVVFFYMLKGGVIQSKKTHSYLSLHILVTTPTATRKEIRPKTDTDNPIIISGSWFDLWIVANGAAVVGGMVGGVDVSGIGSDGAVI